MGMRAATNGVHSAHQPTTGTVLLLDEHPLWLDALQALLTGVGVEVVAQVTSPEEALEIVERERPDALIASIELPTSTMDGLECLRRARERLPELRIVVMSTYEEPFYLSSAIAAGADAYLPKTAAADEIVAALRETLAAGNGRHGNDDLRARELEGAESRPSLTPRELEILRLVARGYTNTQIAERLWITNWTVKFHLVNAYRKLGVSNRTQAARYIFNHGLAQPLHRSA